MNNSYLFLVLTIALAAMACTNTGHDVKQPIVVKNTGPELVNTFEITFLSEKNISKGLSSSNLENGQKLRGKILKAEGMTSDSIVTFISKNNGLFPNEEGLKAIRASGKQILPDSLFTKDCYILGIDKKGFLPESFHLGNHRLPMLIRSNNSWKLEYDGDFEGGKWSSGGYFVYFEEL